MSHLPTGKFSCLATCKLVVHQASHMTHDYYMIGIAFQSEKKVTREMSHAAYRSNELKIKRLTAHCHGYLIICG